MRQHGVLAALPVVLDPLQKQAIGNGGQQMQGGVFGHWPERARMWRHHDVMGFGHGGNLLHLGDAASPSGVGLDHIHEFTLDQLPRAVNGAHALAGGQRHLGGVADALVALEVVRGNRVFNEQQVVGLQSPRQARGVAGGHPGWAMQVDHDVHLVTHRLAQRRHFSHRVGHAATLDGSHTPGLEAQRHFWRVGMGIDADLVTHLAAQQVPDRHAQGLAFDVPQRHVDAGHGTGAHRAGQTMDHDGRHHALPQPLNVGRVLAHQQTLEVLYRCFDHAGPARTFANAHQAFVGVDLDKQPVAGAGDAR